jgi:hypothetical protein
MRNGKYVRKYSVSTLEKLGVTNARNFLTISVPTEKGKTMDKLSQEVTTALAAGMSYGKWKAKQPIVKPVEKPVEKQAEVDKGILDNCRWCGKPFNSIHGAKYCCDECRGNGSLEKARIRDRERYWRKKNNMENM